MEQLPGSLEDLQPQDLSTSSIPTVIDLTRQGEECVLSSTSLDALHVVKSPNWYPNSETGSSDTTVLSGDPAQPNNAFSHTTVTLSYVSRSHVFSTLDSLSRHSPLYGVPTIGKLSLHPPCDLDKGLGETGYSLNQHYLEQVDGPIDLATQSELFQSLSHAQVGLEDNGVACLMPEPQEIHFGVSSSNGDVVKHVKGEEEKSGALENGLGNSSSPETLSSATGEDEEGCNSEELLLMSKKQDPVVISGNMAAKYLSSQGREYISHLEDPISPSATSLDNVDDVFILPQASCSPSGDNSHLETFDEVAWEGLRTEGAVQPGAGISDSNVTTRFNSSAGNKQPAHRRKAVLEPLIDLTHDVCVSDVSENKLTVIPHMNGNAKALQRTSKNRKLPVRAGRGTCLETIVMDINSSRYKVSGCMQSNKKKNAPQPTASDSKCDDSLSVGRRTKRGRAPFSAKTMKHKEVISMKRGKTNNIHYDSCKHSTSDSEINNSKTSNGTPPKFSIHKRSKKEPEHLSHPNPSVDIHMASCPPPPPLQCPKKSKGKATGRKICPSVKTKGPGPTKRRQKKQRWSQSSTMFSPKEPEIRLKYVNYKEERRTYSLDSFSPFVRVQRQQSLSSLCSVINYPNQVRTQHKKGQQQQAHPSGFLSAVVPSTSCLQLGRVSMHSQHQRPLVCCLCGQAANTMDLGDLHGPYYPEGYQPRIQRLASMSGLKDDKDDTDSDSSSCSIRGRGRKCLVPSTPRPLRQKGHLGSYRWTADSTGSPAAKRARLVAGSADMEDWYSPPLLPLEPCEYWLHEDCGIWSAGVFLVKGKVYGLEEAVKVAEETMCSACSDPGATLGCFFKGCPNKYHYRCALGIDCVLIEENFSMKCKKHKNKTFKAPPGTRRDNR